MKSKGMLAFTHTHIRLKGTCKKKMRTVLLLTLTRYTTLSLLHLVYKLFTTLNNLQHKSNGTTQILKT